MSYPGFFAAVPEITLWDPLAEILGVAPGGEMTYRYEDAVKLAGHSCPTVAGAWLMAGAALTLLYPGAIPRRGGVAVAMREAQDQAASGVVANVIGLLTGAAGEGGFQGLGGRETRRDLLSFGQAIRGEVRFTRLDNGAYVELVYHPARVPPDPAMPALMPKVLSQQAEASERAEFGRLWQDRVRRILIDHGDDPGLIEVVASS